VLLGEPPRTAYDLNFRIMSIPVRVHPMFWLVALLMGARGSNDAKQLMIWIGVVLVSILVHELGHAIAMQCYGWRPWITLYGMGGLASYDAGFTSQAGSYGRKGNSTTAQIVISAAGPAAGFLLAAIVISILYASGYWIPFFFNLKIGTGEPLRDPLLWTLAFDLLYVNIFWGLVNLMPIYPLDGGQISRELFLHSNSRDGLRQSIILSMFAAIGIAVYALSVDRTFLAFMFGYLAYSNYQMMRPYGGGGGFGAGGTRNPW